MKCNLSTVIGWLAAIASLLYILIALLIDVILKTSLCIIYIVMAILMFPFLPVIIKYINLYKIENPYQYARDWNWNHEQTYIVTEYVVSKLFNS